LPNDGSDDNSNDGAESLYNINAPIPPLGDSIIENVGVCVGVDSGNFGSMLSYAAVSMKNTAQKLLKWRAEEDGGRKSYLASTLSKRKDFVLPFRNMILQKQSNGDGYVATAPNCDGVVDNNKRKRCNPCNELKRCGMRQINSLHQPLFEPFSKYTKVQYIASNVDQADYEIRRLRKELYEQQKTTARLAHQRNLRERGRVVHGEARF